jgi:protein ImuA
MTNLALARSDAPLGAFAHLDAVWRANELAPSHQPTVGSGFAQLDAELPNAGWPTGALIEILQAQAGSHEWRLLLPALRGCSQLGSIALVGSPHLPNLAAMACMGLASSAVVLIEASQPAERLWAAEQVLRCRDMVALLVWLPQARADQLRRLHLASASHTNGKPRLVFAFRPAHAAQESSAAPLRLHLTGGAHHHLDVQIVKRKGPALDKTLHLAAQLPAMLALRAGVLNADALHADMPHASPAPILMAPEAMLPAWTVDSTYAVDRSASPQRRRKHAAVATA